MDNWKKYALAAVIVMVAGFACIKSFHRRIPSDFRDSPIDGTYGEDFNLQSIKASEVKSVNDVAAPVTVAAPADAGGGKGVMPGIKRALSGLVGNGEKIEIGDMVKVEDRDFPCKQLGDIGMVVPVYVSRGYLEASRLLKTKHKMVHVITPKGDCQAEAKHLIKQPPAREVERILHISVGDEVYIPSHIEYSGTVKKIFENGYMLVQHNREDGSVLRMLTRGVVKDGIDVDGKISDDIHSQARRSSYGPQGPDMGNIGYDPE